VIARQTSSTLSQVMRPNIHIRQTAHHEAWVEKTSFDLTDSADMKDSARIEDGLTSFAVEKVVITLSGVSAADLHRLDVSVGGFNNYSGVHTREFVLDLRESIDTTNAAPAWLLGVLCDALPYHRQFVKEAWKA
jgi:hypothetical protein